MTPNVCYIEKENEVVFNPYIPPVEPEIINFSIRVSDAPQRTISFSAEQGMTWSLFVSSIYNIDNNFSITTNNRVHFYINLSENYITYSKTTEDDMVSKDDVIIAGHQYKMYTPPMEEGGDGDFG